MSSAKTLVAAIALSEMLAISAGAADWPQFRGPNHDGISREEILTAWPTNGLRQVWKRPLTNGFCGIVVGAGKAFTSVTREIDGLNQEVCVALDANTGDELWATPLGRAKYNDISDPHSSRAGTPDNNGGVGPRATPVYDSGKVYTYSVNAALKCMDATTGREIWTCDMFKEHDAHEIYYQWGASPMVEGNMVYVEGGGPGEGLLALDKKDGHVIWKGQNDRATHSTPVAATILGQRQVVFWTRTGVVAVKPTTGDVLWRFPTRDNHELQAVSPMVSGDIVYVSAWYGLGSIAFQISKASAETATDPSDTAIDYPYEVRQLWRVTDRNTENDWCTPVCINGYLYAIFGHTSYGKAPLACLELATGRVMWKQPGFGMGTCLLVAGQVLVLSDAGDLVLVKAHPTAYIETARSHVLAGKCWNYPSVSNGRIYARSTKEAVCVDVAVK